MKRGGPDHPKTLLLAKELEKIYARHRRKASFGGRAEAVGILEALWEWTSKYAIQGNVGKWPDEVIAAGIGWTSFGIELISALISSGWLDRVAGPNRLCIHDLQDHASNTWRQNLEDAGLTWWDGTAPRKYKLQKNSRKTPESGDLTPQPEPEPEPLGEAKFENNTAAASGIPRAETRARHPARGIPELARHPSQPPEAAAGEKPEKYGYQAFDENWPESNATITKRFPATDPPLCRQIIEGGVQAHIGAATNGEELTDKILAKMIGIATRDTQKSAKLYLTTLPVVVKNQLRESARENHHP